jgi:hypothetical protein
VYLTRKQTPVPVVPCWWPPTSTARHFVASRLAPITAHMCLTWDGSVGSFLAPWPSWVAYFVRHVWFCKRDGPMLPTIVSGIISQQKQGLSHMLFRIGKHRCGGASLLYLSSSSVWYHRRHRCTWNTGKQPGTSRRCEVKPAVCIIQNRTPETTTQISARSPEASPAAADDRFRKKVPDQLRQEAHLVG